MRRLGGDHIAVDGKTLRGARGGEGPVHLMSAFASQARWVLAQLPVADKANEITAIPQLLALLDLSGATVTIDAAGCQKKIAGQIIEAGADYVLALKENHPLLYEEVSVWLDSEFDAARLASKTTVDKDHGRIETRRYALSDQFDWLEARKEWAGLSALGLVESRREIGDKVSRTVLRGAGGAIPPAYSPPAALGSRCAVW